MKCSPDLIEAWLDGELDVAQHAALEQHAAECPDCSAAYERLSRLKSGIKTSAPYYNAPPGLREAIQGELRRVATQDERPPVREEGRGMTLRGALLSWCRLGFTVARLVTSPESRGNWLRDAATRAGRICGSVRWRTIYL